MNTGKLSAQQLNRYRTFLEDNIVIKKEKNHPYVTYSANPLNSLIINEQKIS